MQVKAQEAGFMLRGAQTGLVMVPVIDGKPVSPEDAAQLPVDARREIETRRMALDKELRSLFRQLRDIERELRTELRKMETDSIQFTLDPLLSEFDDDYKGIVWNAYCTDALGMSSFAAAYYTFSIDTAVPTINRYINYSSTAPDCKGFTVEYNASEAVNITFDYGGTGKK